MTPRRYWVRHYRAAVMLGFISRAITTGFVAQRRVLDLLWRTRRQVMKEW